jgi:hypothetical protein
MEATEKTNKMKDLMNGLREWAGDDAPGQKELDALVWALSLDADLYGEFKAQVEQERKRYETEREE